MRACVCVCVCVWDRESGESEREFKGRRQAFIGIHSLPLANSAWSEARGVRWVESRRGTPILSRNRDLGV